MRVPCNPVLSFVCLTVAMSGHVSSLSLGAVFFLMLSLAAPGVMPLVGQAAGLRAAGLARVAGRGVGFDALPVVWALPPGDRIKVIEWPVIRARILWRFRKSRWVPPNDSG